MVELALKTLSTTAMTLVVLTTAAIFLRSMSNLDTALRAAAPAQATHETPVSGGQTFPLTITFSQHPSGACFAVGRYTTGFSSPPGFSISWVPDTYCAGARLHP